MSLQLLKQFERANDGIAALVNRDILAFMNRLDPSRPEGVKADLFEYVPTLIAQYGDIAATVAADWYDELREAEGIPGRFQAPMADLVPLEVVNGRLGYATRQDGPLYAGALDVLTDFVATVANEYALQPGRDTVMQAAHKDKAAYARVPERGACKFCLMLASRGFVYSKSTVGDSKKFHGKCRCNAMPVWDEARAKSEFGYDPDALYDQYLEKHDGKSKAASPTKGGAHNLPKSDATNLVAQLASLEKSLPLLKARAANGENVAAAIKWQTERIAEIKRKLR